MSSAICFNLGQSKILSSGNGLNASAIAIEPYHPAYIVWTFLLLENFLYVQGKVYLISQPHRRQNGFLWIHN